MGMGCTRERGFSLIEVMVVVAMSGVIAMGVALQLQWMSSSMAQADGKVGTQALVMDLRSQLSSSQFCTDQLVTKTGFSTTPGAVYNFTYRLAPGTLVGANQRPQGYAVEVTSLSMRNITDTGTNINGNRVYSASVFLRTKGAGGDGLTMAERAVGPVLVRVNSGTIVSCGNDLISNAQNNDDDDPYDLDKLKLCKGGGLYGETTCCSNEQTTVSCAFEAASNTPTNGTDGAMVNSTITYQIPTCICKKKVDS